MLNRRRANLGRSNQKLKLFIRGKIISLVPIIRGISQFPKPPMLIGITKKKIITKAWAVTTTLYKCSSPIHAPVDQSSSRIIHLRLSPIKPAQILKIKYNVPMVLWFVEVRMCHQFKGVEVTI